jgi:hypothetical protein
MKTPKLKRENREAVRGGKTLSLVGFGIMKRVVEFYQSRSQECEHDQRNDDDPHLHGPIVTPANALQTSVRRAVPTGDPAAQID